MCHGPCCCHHPAENTPCPAAPGFYSGDCGGGSHSNALSQSPVKGFPPATPSLFIPIPPGSQEMKTVSLPIPPLFVHTPPPRWKGLC